MSFLASMTAAEASFSVAEVFSPASFRACVDTDSSSSERKRDPASTKAFTFFSQFVTASTTSAMMEAIFLSEVSFLKLVSFLAVASRRVWSWVNSSVTVFCRACAYFFDSASFVLMKVCAWPIALPAWLEAASHSAMAFVDSSAGNTSMPFKKGISASWHFTSDSSALSTFSPARSTTCCEAKPSRCDFKTVTTPWSFLLEAVARVLISFSSSLVGPSVVALIFPSTVLRACVMAVCVGPTSFSAEATSSSDICPDSAAAVMRLAFSTSSSTPLILSAISASAFLASTRALKSFLKVLYGFSFFCASVNFCCIEENSERAFFLVSGAYFLAAESLRLITLRASVILFCPSKAAASISCVALLRSSLSSSGGSANRGAAMMWQPSTESSAPETRSMAAGNDSWSSFVSFSSCAF
mmetsp:Transcript_29974/g.63790  ORF Transcript_29974/g.63790 Transcript_29974/m.63790 type:complete len:413 (-) Transcript_29974:409-1647(-)